MSGQQDSSICVALDGCVGIRNIDAVRDNLLQALAQHRSVIIDCSKIETVDASFIQLLFAARRSAQEADKQLRLHSPPAEGLREVLQRGGFIQPEADADPFWSGA